MTYQPKVYREQGGDKIVVETGGEIRVNGTGKITDDGVQASAIADAAAITGGESPTEAEHNTALTKINSILAALRGVGIIAT
jgi:hypothetical protein